MPWGMSTLVLIFLRLFVFELRARTGQTDRRTGKTRNAAYGRPHSYSDQTIGSSIYLCRQEPAKPASYIFMTLMRAACFSSFVSSRFTRQGIARDWHLSEG